MKRVLLLMAAFVVLSATPSVAQSNFSAGVKAGVNFAKISLDPDDEACCDNRTGFIGGLFTTMGINENVSIQPEFLYSMQGAKIEEDGFEGEIKVDYFQIPVLVRADFAGGGTRPFIVFGPTLGFKLNAKEEFEGEENDIDDDVETFDFGFAIGAGVQFGVGSLEARYTHGLSDADKDDDSKAKHRVFSILFGIKFGS